MKKCCLHTPGEEDKLSLHRKETFTSSAGVTPFPPPCFYSHSTLAFYSIKHYLIFITSFSSRGDADANVSHFLEMGLCILVSACLQMMPKTKVASQSGSDSGSMETGSLFQGALCIMKFLG